jgi:hypothetical protein
MKNGLTPLREETGYGDCAGGSWQDWQNTYSVVCLVTVNIHSTHCASTEHHAMKAYW